MTDERHHIASTGTPLSVSEFLATANDMHTKLAGNHKEISSQMLAELFNAAKAIHRHVRSHEASGREQVIIDSTNGRSQPEDSEGNKEKEEGGGTETSKDQVLLQATIDLLVEIKSIWRDATEKTRKKKAKRDSNPLGDGDGPTAPLDSRGYRTNDRF